jgi:hypothetical protein
MLALEDPELSVLNSENVGTLVADSSNYANVIESVCDQKTADVALESLPRAEQQTPVAQE